MLSLSHLYSWTRPESLENPVIAGKAGWLAHRKNKPQFFYSDPLLVRLLCSPVY
jgi:hypothetical protein